MNDLSHLDAQGQPAMVDVSGKTPSARAATAVGRVRLCSASQAILARGGDTKKGNVLMVARLAGIQGAKRCSDLIPLCHPLPLEGIDVDLRLDLSSVRVEATVRCYGRTGVEMEALCAVSAACLCVYDMLKAVSHDLVIEGIELLAKDGGRHGRIRRTEGGTCP